MNNNKDYVGEFIKSRQKDLEKENENVKFSVTLESLDAERLQQLADKLELKRSQLAASLIEEGIKTACMVLGLDYKTGDPLLSNKIDTKHPLEIPIQLDEFKNE